MNGTGALKSANSLPGELIQTLMQGLAEIPQQALKAAAVGMEAQVKMQQQATAMQTVALMTGVGTQINTVA